MSDQISWYVELQVRPGQLDALRALTSEMVESTKTEAGALVYERFISDDRQVVHVFRRFTVFGTPTPELKEILDPLGADYAATLAGFSRI